MKRKYSLLAVLLLSACASAPQSQAEKANQPLQLSANGPTIINARSEPGMIQLNSDLQPISPAQVVADVKDFKAGVTDVRLKFADVPIEVPMENVGGTTWRAELTPQELQMLAISGKTVKYKTQIMAKDANGNTATSLEPIFVSVKAPSVAHYG